MLVFEICSIQRTPPPLTCTSSNLQSLADALQALQSRGKEADGKAEKQLTALLTIPLDSYNVVTVLSLKNYPNVMNLLPPAVRAVPPPPPDGCMPLHDKVPARKTNHQFVWVVRDAGSTSDCRRVWRSTAVEHACSLSGATSGTGVVAVGCASYWLSS